MTTLHIIKTNTANALETAIKYSGESDGFVFIDEAVYLVSQAILQDQLKDKAIYFLRDDAVARAVLARISKEFKAISYEDFVDLTLAFKNSVSW